MPFPKPKEQLKQITQASVDVISKEALLQKLTNSYDSKKPLRIKAGFDPSRPDLHIGHTVLLNKLKLFQDFGHQVLFLIGDFTAQIGDPSGSNQTRPLLTLNEVQSNAQTYTQQVFKVLDKAQTKVYFNSEWMNKMSAKKLIELASWHTVARMLERDDFSKRYKKNLSISLHEFLYPLIQGYDSVVMRADIELGATDQLFNLLVGRELQKKAGLNQQCVLTMPLLEGTDGVKKMSKSYDNYIALEDSPKEIFGKTMKISDDQMLRWYELLTNKTIEEIKQLKHDLQSKNKHPKEAKMDLAQTLVTRFYGVQEGKKARVEFDRIFSAGELPKNIPKHIIPHNASVWICYLLREVNLASSTSEARRLIEGGALEIGGNKIQDPHLKLSLKVGEELILKAGKRRFAKIQVS